MLGARPIAGFMLEEHIVDDSDAVSDDIASKTVNCTSDIPVSRVRV
jgi:hypothetical protein